MNRRGKAEGLTWDDVMERQGNALLLFARHWTPSLADAEDVLQEGVLRAYRAHPEVRGAAIVPLVYRAVRWAALDQARRRGRRMDRETRAAAEGEDEAWFECGIERAERNADIEAALRGLPEEQREVLVMKIWGGLTFREIAAALEIPPGTASSRYRYALRGLRTALTPTGELVREPA